jgi:hypothetical protein
MYPALYRETDGVALRLFWSETAALMEHAAAVRHLLEEALAEELAWSMHAATLAAALVERAGGFTTKDELERTLERLTVDRVLSLPAEVPRDGEGFAALVASAAERIPLAVEQTMGLLSGVIEGYERCARTLARLIERHPHSPLYQAIVERLYDSFDGYMGMVFDESISPAFLDCLPRYLRAFEGRIETAFANPRRYRTVMADIEAFRRTLRRLQARPGAHLPARRAELESYARWIEELAVAQFGRSKVKPLVSITPEGLAARGRELLEAW